MNIIKFTSVIIVLLTVSIYCDSGIEISSNILESKFTETAPVIDGSIDDIWGSATPLTVTVREAIGADDPFEVIMRSIHTDDMVYFLAQWHDETKSDMRDPYIWNENISDYERPSRPDDQFAIEFPIEGDFDINMLSTEQEYTADVWHWKAGRGNPVGWVDDKTHIISHSPIYGGRKYEMGGHATVYIARLMDEGTASYRLKNKPDSFEGDVVNSFDQPGNPTGSLADVRGKGMHDGNSWTLELSRKFETGHGDDAVIDPGQEIAFAIAVLNDELYYNHSVSTELILRFIK